MDYSASNGTFISPLLSRLRDHHRRAGQNILRTGDQEELEWNGVFWTLILFHTLWHDLSVGQKYNI